MQTVSLIFYENHSNMQPWTWAAHLQQCLKRLSPPPSVGQLNEYQPYGPVIIHGDHLSYRQTQRSSCSLAHELAAIWHWPTFIQVIRVNL